MIDRAEASDPRLLEILRGHPKVGLVQEGREAHLTFHQGPWSRRVFAGDSAPVLAGLVELIDNNPLVCADEASVPDAASTLALIALGPLIRAGLLVESPTMMTNLAVNQPTLDAFLAKELWNEGITVSTESFDFGSVAVATVMAAIRTPDRLKDVDDLYGEAFGRSFFVRRDEESAWDTSLVARKPHAAFRLRISPDAPNSLLTVQVMADLNGKCGACQVVHCMNVMAGLEETLGIADC